MGPVEPELLEVFERAFSQGLMLSFSYRDGRGNGSERTVEPHAMLVRAPLWYIVAWDPRKDALRMFRMDRVRAPRVLEDAPFRRRPLKALQPLPDEVASASALARGYPPIG